MGEPIESAWGFKSSRESVLMISLYIFCSDRGFGIIFAASGRVIELSAHNEQAPGQLPPVSCVIANCKSLLTLRNYKTGDVHT